MINLYLSSGVRGWRRRPGPAPPDRTGGGPILHCGHDPGGGAGTTTACCCGRGTSSVQRLFLMTAELKNELYLLKKNSDDIEQVMTNAYRLYERLGEKEGESGELSALALSIARDVHEVKKGQPAHHPGHRGGGGGGLRPGADGIPGSDAHSGELHPADAGEKRASIRLECRRTANFSTQEHYRLLSILKNLVTNAIEAIRELAAVGSCWWRSGWRVTLCFSPCQTTAPASRSAPCTICSRWAIPPNLTRRPATSTGRGPARSQVADRGAGRLRLGGEPAGAGRVFPWSCRPPCEGEKREK